MPPGGIEPPLPVLSAEKNLEGRPPRPRRLTSIDAGPVYVAISTSSIEAGRSLKSRSLLIELEAGGGEIVGGIHQPNKKNI